jgi:hypothetical protein
MVGASSTACLVNFSALISPPADQRKNREFVLVFERLSLYVATQIESFGAHSLSENFQVP